MAHANEVPPAPRGGSRTRSMLTIWRSVLPATHDQRHPRCRAAARKRECVLSSRTGAGMSGKNEAATWSGRGCVYGGPAFAGGTLVGTGLGTLLGDFVVWLLVGIGPDSSCRRSSS